MVQRRKFTQSVPLPEKTTFSTEIVAEDGYTPGRLNISQGTLEKDITIMATPATPISCTISATKYKNQDIIIYIYNSTGTYVTQTYTNIKSISLPYNTIFSVSLVPHEGYVKSSLTNIVEGNKYNLVKNVTISANGEATPINCELEIKHTEHQVITTTTDLGVVVESDVEDDVSIVVAYWSKYASIVTANPGYHPGVLNRIGEITVESEHEIIEATPATEFKHRISIYKYPHQKIIVSATFEDNTEEYSIDTLNPVAETSTYKVYELFDSTEYTIKIIPDYGYKSSYSIIRYIEDGQTKTINVVDTSQEFVLDKDIDIIASSEASLAYHTISLIQSQDQVMYLTSGEYEDITGSVNLKHGSEYIIHIIANNPTYFKPGDPISSDEPLELISEDTYRGIIMNDTNIYVTSVVLK